MGDGGVIELDPLLFAEVLELFGGEICSIIGDDAMWHTETEDDGPDEIDGSRCRCVCDWHSFYPLCELVDCHQ